MLEQPQQGDILFQGEAIHSKGQGHDRQPSDTAQVRHLRTHLSMVFQQFNLCLISISRTLSRPRLPFKVARDEAIAEAQALLDKVGIGDKGDRYPAELSGGQQQRAATSGVSHAAHRNAV